jgi:hypothetical protein
MSANRRVFLSRSAVAVGLALGTSPMSLLARAPRPPATFATSGADQEVLNFAATYGRDPFFVGGGVLGRTRGIVAAPISLVVRADNVAALSKSLDAMPFKSVHAAGNTLSFEAGGSVYQLENLSSEEYGQRLARVQTRGGTAFAHDAARYPLAQRQVQDPLGSMAGGESQLRRTAAEVSLTARVGQLLRGLVEAGRYALVPDAEFDAFRRRTLSESPGTAEDAAAVASLLLGAVAPLSAGGQASRLAELATSALASASFGRHSARGGAQTMARYQQLRPVGNRLGLSSGALWLAALLGPSWPQSGVHPQVTTTDYLSNLQTQAALAEARQLFRTGPSSSK